MSRRVRIQRPRPERARDELIELSPGVYEFVPAWAVKDRRKGAK